MSKLIPCQATLVKREKGLAEDGNNILAQSTTQGDDGYDESYVFTALRLAFPSNTEPGNRIVVALDIYLDESGTHNGSDTVVVGGFISTADRWLKFEAEWRRALDDFGIDMFRMSKFANRADVFRDWPEPLRQARLQRLINIIRDHVGGSVGVAIPVTKFNLMLSDKAKKYCGGAYGLAAIFLFIDVGNTIHEIHKEARAAYVMEAGALGASEVLRVFQQNMRDPEQRERLRLLSLRFEDKRKYLPLQAADILAYELYKHLPKQPITDNLSRYPLRQLAELPRRWHVPHDESLVFTNKILTYKADEEAANEDKGRRQDGI